MRPSPPNTALKFLRWFCREDYIEEIEGDLIELYENQYELSPTLAKRNFNWRVVRYFRPEFIKAFKLGQNTTTMVKNDLKIAWRQLLKQKMYSSIKIGGFALGIAACLLITLFVKDELRYDQHYIDKDRIFRLNFEFEGDGSWVWFPAATARVLVSDFPEIEKSGRLLNSQLFGAGTNEIRWDGQAETFHESGFVYVDPSLMEILEIEYLKGDKATALTQPNTMVISKRKAQKYFPYEDPIGKTIILESNTRGNSGNRTYTITGVVDIKEASHFQYDFFMTLSEVEFWNGEQDSWNTTNYHTYFKTKPHTDPVALEEKLDLLTKNYFAPAWISAGDQGVPEASEKTSYAMQPISP